MLIRITSVLLLAISTAAAGALAAEPKANIAAIEAIQGVQAKPVIFQASHLKEPLVFRSAEDAGKYFDEANLKTLTKKADFAQQIVLVFAWRGSGQDRLDAAVAESSPEQITFKLQPGRTKDLRPHLEIYALRSNVHWQVR